MHKLAFVVSLLALSVVASGRHAIPDDGSAITGVRPPGVRQARAR